MPLHQASKSPPEQSGGLFLGPNMLSTVIRAWLLQPILRGMKMNQDELLVKLTDLDAAVEKIGTETTALLAEVQALTDALAAAGSTSPEVDAALAAVQARVASVDAMVPDAP